MKATDYLKWILRHYEILVLKGEKVYMKKRIIAILLSLCLVISMMPATALADVTIDYSSEAAIASAKELYGQENNDKFYYVGSDKTVDAVYGYATENGDGTYTLTFVGEGNAHTNAEGNWCSVSNIKDKPMIENSQQRTDSGCLDATYVTDTRPWKDYVLKITKFVVKDGVTSVGERVMKLAVNLELVELASSVTLVNNQAFHSCVKLTQLIGGEGVEEYGISAFQWAGFSSFDFQGAKTIGPNSFMNCENLKSVNIGTSVTSIGKAAFQLSALESITIPSNVASFDSQVFYSCKSLSTVVMDDVNFTTIPAQTFQFSSANTIVLPKLSSVGDHAFNIQNTSCRIFVPDANSADLIKSSGNYSNQPSILVTNGGSYTNSTDGFQSVVKSGYVSIWYEDSGLETVTNDTIPQSGKSYYAKWIPTSGNCGDPADNDGKNVTWTFDSATGILTISGTGAMEDYSVLDPTSGQDIVPDGYTPAPWISLPVVKVVVEEGVSTVGNRAFHAMPNLKYAEIASTVEKIGLRAFNWSDNLQSITFAKGSKLKEIGFAALNNVDHVRSITIPESVTKIDSWAIANNDLLEELIFAGNKVETIGYCGIRLNPCLTSIILPDGLKTIEGYGVGTNGSNNGAIVVPDTVNTFADQCFNAAKMAYFKTEGSYKKYISVIQRPQTIYAITNGGFFSTGTVLNSNSLAVPIKEGYVFGGWYTDKELTTEAGYNEVDGVKQYNAESGKTYYAKWNPVEFNLSYNLDGGSVESPNPTTYTIETPDFTLNNPTKAGYVFAGWTWEGQDEPITNATITQGSTGHKEFTANWIAITPYTITVNNIPANIYAGERATGASAALSSEFGRTYEHVRFVVDITSKPEGATVQILAKDTNSVEWDMAKVGWGPAEGFAIAGPVNNVTSFDILADKTGEYTATFKLIDLAHENAVIASGTQTITVVEKPSSGAIYIPPAQKPVIGSNDNAKTELSSDGTKLTITAEEGYKVVDVLVNGVSKGAVTELTGLKTGDKVEVVTEKVEEPAADPDAEQARIEKIIKGVEATTLKARSNKTEKGIKITWEKSKGYKVDYYEIYRSTKRYSGYGKEPFFTTKSGEATTYTNTKDLTRGTTYYYKVRGVRIIDGQKHYTEYSTKAWRTW